MINRVLESLPQEKRKGYLLSPQATLTMQGLIERILQEDGITKEMLEAQEQRLNLIQRLANTSDPQALEELARSEDQLIDREFFGLLARLIEASAMSGDEQSARRLNELQGQLLPVTTFGREVQAQSKEVEAALEDLRAEGEGLSRDKLLELVINAPNETRLQALVSLARPAMDYAFFQLLSEKIDRARGSGRERLTELRTELLQMTEEIDQQIEAHVAQIRQVIQEILKLDDVEVAMQSAMPAVDSYFIRELEGMIVAARESGDLERSGKLQKMLDFIEQASAGPPGAALIEEYIYIEDEPGRQQFLETHQDDITPDFLNMLTSVALQAESSDDPVFAEQAKAANRQALRFSMQRSMNA